MSAGKFYPIKGEGSFIRSRQALLTFLLLELGFKISGPKCFKDLTDLDDNNRRTFAFTFNGAMKLKFSNRSVRMVAEIAEAIRSDQTHPAAEVEEFRRIYQAYPEQSSAPVDTLRGITDSQRLINRFRAFLQEIGSIRKHVRVRDGRGLFFDMYADMTPEEMQAEMDRLAG